MTSKFKAWIVMLLSCILLYSGSADASGKFATLTGGFTSHQVECDTFCTGGPLTGGLAGTLAWHMSTMEATSDPDVLKLVGVNTITTANGTFSGTDVTIWNVATGDFIDITIISSGTGAFAGVQGTLVIQGGFDAATGTGTSHYVALLKFP
jgi:hypothetical protein